MTLTSAPESTHDGGVGASSAPARNVQTNDFFDLAQRVKLNGLMDRNARQYIGRVIVLTGGFAVAAVLFGLLGSSWWQLGVAVLFGILFTQAAFISHDAAHQQIFASGRRNEWAARMVGNGIVGMSYGWWTRKHNKHHANPNVVGKDGDIETGALVFVPEEAAQRHGFMAWIGKRQGWLFFPLLMFFGPVLHFKAVHSIITTPKLKHRRAELMLVSARLIGFPAVVFLLLGPWLGAAFLAVQLAVFGVYMGASFAPNHKGMPLIPKDASVDFLRRQVLTSRNIRGGRVMDWAMGGLNYQIEHHLFPRMASPQLHKVKPLVEEFCAEQEIPYTETGLIESYGIVIRYLNRVGLGYSDPMECPITAQFRPR